MARRMVGDDQDVFRVVVTQRRMVRNPDYVREGPYGRVNPRVIPSDETETEAFGPYNSLGAARGQATSARTDFFGEPRENVLSVHIEKAATIWSVVE